MCESILVPCSCKNEFQDRRYGKGVRVGTPLDKSRKSNRGLLSEAVCTCCGAKRPFRGTEHNPGANGGRG